MFLTGKVQEIQIFNISTETTSVLARIRLRVRDRIFKIKIGPIEKSKLDHCRGAQKFKVSKSSSGYSKAIWMEPDDEFSDDEFFEEALQAAKQQKI